MTAGATTAPPVQVFPTTRMVDDDNVASVEHIITKWLDSAASPNRNAASLCFNDTEDLHAVLTAIRHLHRSMRSSSSSTFTSSLAHAHHLLHKSMKFLQAEFHSLLVANRDRFDSDSNPSSVSTLSGSISSLSDFDDSSSYHSNDAHSTAIADIRSIADCMTTTGYSRECVDTYMKARRSVISDGLHRLGFERLTSSQIQKLDWVTIDSRISCWIAAASTAIRTLFSVERRLCDAIFGASEPMRDSCFAEIVTDPAIHFFGFPEVVAAKVKRSPERIFRFLDMHGSIGQLLPEIDALFSPDSTSAVRSQVRSAIVGLADAIRAALGEFEAAIHHDTSRSIVPGAGIHPLTRYAMDYLRSVADRASSFIEIFEDDPLPSSAIDLVSSSSSSSSSPCSTIHEEEWEEEEVPPSISARLAWLLLVLVCKLDGRAGLYRDAAASYLFLANNLHYIVGAVRGSNLSLLLGGEWAARHEEKARAFVGRFEKVAWEEVAGAIGHVAMADWAERFEEACRRQSGLAVVSGKVRSEVEESVMRKVWAPYCAAYESYGTWDTEAVRVRLKPDEVRRRLAKLYEPGSGMMPPSEGSGSDSGSGSGKRGRWRSALLKLRKRGSHHSDRS